MKRINRIVGSLNIDHNFYDFIDKEVCNGLEITCQDFFNSLSEILYELKKENLDLLNKRDLIQAKIDSWCRQNSGNIDPIAHKSFLKDIGYIVPKVADFVIDVDNVDDEIAKIAGPQLVVPITSERFVLNAINARWGSLFDCLYATNVIPTQGHMATSFAHNLQRVNKTAELACDFLDKAVPLKGASYRQIISRVQDNGSLIYKLNGGGTATLANPEQFIGTDESGNVLLKNNNLHIEIIEDQESSCHNNGIVDVILESAVTTIVDFEDSAATVSAAEKIHAYRNYLELMKGKLSAAFTKNGESVSRVLSADKKYQDVNGNSFVLSGASLILARNVGIHMMTELVTNSDGKEIPEGILDAMVTSLIALHDIKTKFNSKKGSIYIVKPKLHGPEEVSFTVKLFSLIEKALKLKQNTIKIGVMDEERRTSVNLKACIKAAKNRIIFINTGFLDRTGDEIHTSMLAGAMRCKSHIKEESWYDVYETSNVYTALDCGFYKEAQIGKGMWPQPDKMREMLDTKMEHLEAGANCSWVPSPTAATLHSTHYHLFNVFECQENLLSGKLVTNQDDLLKLPLLKSTEKLSKEAIINEINNNAQGILGYVVRWINHGVGCSKVQDINHIGLMEDRATLRISSQHLANWLHHEVCSPEQVNQAFRDMALVVDQQNARDPHYINMAPDYNGLAFQASLALVFEGKEQPNGYTEDVLVRYRRKFLKLD